ncbi:L-aspartate oxidase [Planctomycetes bacterium Pan216]|uniref:L-aspartate oxidase n=1 Tax=Kolteria novifilia TaxID=2527975 RepID=A0A518B9S9_9BACT|nr:L-aspartate oxidase [Planctomycetes bacterium Pan216]
MLASDPPRYLVSFHPKRIIHRFTDVLIVGSGLAGLRAALAVDPACSVMIITKVKARKSNSHYAQGGIAAVWDPEDSFDAHVQDTLDAGKGLCDPKIAQLVVREGPLRVRELIEWGTAFDEANGDLALTREGGHSASRVVHALGDATGKEVMRAVLEEVRSRPNILVDEKTFIVDLLTNEGRCVGALTYSRSGPIQAIWAKQTVIAAGGSGQLFRETTNPSIATGDGMAMAYRAGATLRDMEFVQFHPTVLYVAGSSRSLVSEAVRGEGAYLRDCNGHRFMPEFTPQKELAPRDVVARAIATQMSRTQHSCVYLDLSHLNADKVRERFPGITKACRKCGLDFARDPIPVRPGAHYMVGGIATDAQGKSSLEGLWACGEVACTGLHGANRLASNSLLEALVFGERCGSGASERALAEADDYRPLAVSHDVAQHAEQELDVADIRNSLQSMMFRSVGIERDASKLATAAESVQFWSQYVLSREFPDAEGWELQNMLVVASLIIAAATERSESRGTHFRTDCPESDPGMARRHLLLSREHGLSWVDMEASDSIEITAR